MVFHATGPAAVSGGGTLRALASFSLKTGAFIFGSGLAIVPFLREGVVHDHHCLTDTSSSTPSRSAWPRCHHRHVHRLLTAGLPGAVVATVAIFTVSGSTTASRSATAQDSQPRLAHGESSPSRRSL